MGFAVVHMQKIKVGGMRGVQSHIYRENEPKTNPDVDMSRSVNNYALVNNPHLANAVKGVIGKLVTTGKTPRSDAVVMCSFIITSDEQTMKAMPEEWQRAFFQDAVDWFRERYGKEQVVSAVVHMDETTPHLHLGVVPIRDGRLTAKTIFTPRELREIQSKFVEDVASQYGMKRGKEGSTRRHLKETEFKLKANKEKLQVIEQQIKASQTSLQAAQNQLAVETAMVTGMTAAGSVRAIRERKGHFGAEDTVEISKNDFEKAQQALNAVSGAYKALQRARSLSDVKKHEEEKNVLQGQIEALQKQLRDSDAKLRSMSWELKDTSDRYDAFVAEVNQTFERLEKRLRVEFPSATQEEVHEFLMAVIEEREPRQRNDMEIEL